MLIHSPKELSHYIANMRKNKQLSQQKTAELVGLRQKTISGFENKSETAKLSTMFQLLFALDLELIVQPKNCNDKLKNEWTQEW